MDKNELKQIPNNHYAILCNILIEIKEAIRFDSETIEWLSTLFITGKSQKLREYIGKTIVIENNTGQIKGTLISVTDNWIEVKWESESTAENKNGITFMAIDHITAFCLAKEDNGN